MTDLCEFEIEVLESLAGLRDPIPWGAALGAALEGLKGRGLVTKLSGKFCLTADGVVMLKEYRKST